MNRSTSSGILSVVAVACALAAAGCSSSSDPTTSSGGSSGATGTSSGASTSACATDSRADVYVAGLTKTTADATSVKVMAASPAPPAKLTNTLTLQVNDAAGKPVDGASLSVVPWMPDHGHGSSITPAIAPGGNGVYDVTDLFYVMPGLWRITVTIQTPNAAPQDAVFNFCIDG